MTTINCTSDCLYQVDGKCTYRQIASKTITPNENCTYYSPLKKQV